MLRRWRFPPAVVTAGFVVVTAWNQGANIAIPVFAVAALGTGDTGPAVLTISLIAIAVLVALMVTAVVAFIPTLEVTNGLSQSRTPFPDGSVLVG